MTFQIHALPAKDFASLFAMSDQELSARNACRMTVDSAPGYPCRISLRDADPGKTVILANYQHQPADSPYRSSHAIYVTEGATQAAPESGDVPEMIRSRLISLRLFNDRDMIVDGRVLQGDALADALVQSLADHAVAYGHIHFAGRGCFAARVTRAK